MLKIASLYILGMALFWSIFRPRPSAPYMSEAAWFAEMFGRVLLIGAILGAIVRGEEIIIPQGDTIVLPHDRIIIFALQQVLPKLEELLTVKLEYF